jgi:riboflavin synthase
MKYIVEKGSVTIDGISLTVADVGSGEFKVSIIPHTAQVTILGERKIGDSVNLENDIIGKYVEKLLGYGEPAYGQAGKPGDSHSSGKQEGDSAGSGITMDFLRENGF